MTHGPPRWRPLRLSLAGLASTTLVASLAVAGSPVSATPPEVAPAAGAAAVEQQVVDELATGGTTAFWVHLEDQADLSAARGIADWAERGWFVYEQLTQTADASQAGLTALLDAEGADYQSFWIANVVKVTGDEALLNRVTGLPAVSQVTADWVYELPDPEPAEAENGIHAVEWNIDRIGAPQVWDTFGVTGEDIVVGSIDTGVQFDHPALVDQYRGNLGNGEFDHNYNWFDPSRICGSPSLAPCDNNNHGTHTMGTMVGDDGGGNQIGVAPGATWMTAKGCETSFCSSDALLASFQFMLAPTDLDGENADPGLRPHVVNNSWGDDDGSDTTYRESVQAWVAAGIFPAFSNGNAGPSCGTVGSPASFPETFGVGAFDINGNIYTNSSRGPAPEAFGGQIKPQVTAPGVAVRSSIPSDSYALGTGTSMAAPHVSATVGLMWSAAPSLRGDLETTSELLEQTAEDTEDLTCGGTPENNNVWGQGKLDAFAAVELSRSDRGTLMGSVVDADTGDPVGGAEVSILDERERQRSTGPEGTYSIPLPVGEYTVTVSAFGYDPQIENVTIIKDETTVQDFRLAPPDGRRLSLTPDALDFGVVPLGSTAGPLSVTLTGTGAKPVTVTKASDPDAGYAPAGGTCGAPPFKLSHLETCTLDFTFEPAVLDPVETTVSLASNAPASPHSVTLRGTGTTLMARVGAAEMGSGESQLITDVIDPAGEFAYFGTNTVPGQVVKVDLNTFERVDAITLESGENFLRSAVIDPAGEFAYFGASTLPGRVVKVDLETFERVDAITLESGENNLRSAVMDPAGEFAYFGTFSTPGGVVKIDLDTFERADAIVLEPDERVLSSAVIDPAGEFAYFGTATVPSRVVKVDLRTLERVDAFTLGSEELQLTSAVIDPAGEFAYFGTLNAPGRVVRIDLETFEPIDVLVLRSGENGFVSAVIDPAGDFAYFGTNTSPARVVKIDLMTFARADGITLESGENRLFSAVMDPAGDFAYFGTLTAPGRVVKVKVGTEILLSAEGRLREGMHAVDLSWTGATLSDIDVFRDGELIVTVPNTGSHTDLIGARGRATYTYQVCQAGTSNCSDEATVTFGGPSG